MDPEPGKLGPSSAGTDFEAPGHQRLSNWEIERTSTVDGCLVVRVSSSLGGNIFSLEELIIGTQVDSQIPASSASSKTVFMQMSCKSKDNEPASEENKQLDPGGKEGEATALKSVCTGILLFFLGELWAWMPGLFLVLLLVCLLCVLRKIR